ncbi:hypothetical protein MFLAVUS_007073 [Mucor flavus]|uniref:Uncharacterized protein n=1 Tax=Mucor flavus TaxID=439312 RepID=A0ABP9Z3A5_9FUNG
MPTSYYRVVLDSDSSENISFPSIAADDMITRSYAYIETPTLYSPLYAKPVPFPIMAAKTDTPIFYVSDLIPTSYDRVKDYINKKLDTLYSFIIAVCMAIVNFFFPFVKRTVCDISIDRPSTLMSAFNFVLKALYVVDEDSLEEVNATIKCIRIPTDKRNHQPVLIAVIVVFLIALLAKYGRRIRMRYNRLPVFQTLDRIAFPFPNLREMGINWYNRFLESIDWLY